MLRDYLKKNLPKNLHKPIKKGAAPLIKIFNSFKFVYKKLCGNWVSLALNSRKTERFLEIGPGMRRLVGFETLNVVADGDVDYIYDAAKKLPFKDNTFDLIYASNILEHIPWYQTEKVLSEWVRVLKPGGALEIWVPDGLKICEEVIKAEMGQESTICNDGWYRFNEAKDSYVWANGRIYTYGDGTGNTNHQNWHRALFTPKSLLRTMQKVNLNNVSKMSIDEVRGYSHGWINLGVKGTKVNPT